MIRMRFVALIGAFALLLAGYATYVTYLRPAPEFVGVADPAHVAAVTALIAALPAPEGATLDPYGTWCDAASASCWTSTTQQPKALASALTTTLVARGSKVRSHQCLNSEAPGGEKTLGCLAVLDYRGSRIELSASNGGRFDNGGRTFVRLDSRLVTPQQSSSHSQSLGAWATVNPLPPAWTIGVTCTRSDADGCRVYGQRETASPVIALPVAQVCDGIRASLRGRFFFGFDVDQPASASRPAYCHILAHRFRSRGDKDGEGILILATSSGPGSSTLTFHFGPEL